MYIYIYVHTHVHTLTYIHIHTSTYYKLLVCGFPGLEALPVAEDVADLARRPYI